ncbi:Ig-like domain repeat protein [Kitasatospora sp. NPDC056138]|uniref:Ig-like domain repeat protein n=1 Tax=Kitasatospora sp. NPDC056138 TaxID=3345724 RepID=UPI0035D6A048
MARRALAAAISLGLTTAPLAFVPSRASASGAPRASASHAGKNARPGSRIPAEGRPRPFLGTVPPPVDASALANSTGGFGEPSIAINPANPDQIVITRFHQQFWNANPASPNADLLYSTDGGVTWSEKTTITPPPGITTGTAPADQTVDYGRDGTLYGTFLTCPNNCAQQQVVTGSTSDPANPASWTWNVQSGSAQLTSGTRTLADQPWLLVNSDPDAPTKDKVYVAYEDLAPTTPTAQVAVADGVSPVGFTRDNSPGTVDTNKATSGGIRLATDRRNGWVYSLFQTGSDTGDPQNITYRLNRSKDGGKTWGLPVPGNPNGIDVATADTHQGRTYKFGGVNALIGGIDHAAVDPSNGDVYVAYGADVSGNNQIRIRRLTDDGADGLTVGAEHTVSASTNAALPSVAVLGDGTVGVLYMTSDGTNGSGYPTFSAHIARSTDHGMTFTDTLLQSFASSQKPATGCAGDPNCSTQRVLGDFQQLKAVGNVFYGAFPGNTGGVNAAAPPMDAMFFKTVPQTTQTTLAPSANPSVYGQPVSFTATVTPVPDGGTVSFTVDGTPLGGPVPVNTTGQATSSSITTLTPGPHNVDATYHGNGDFADSTATTLVQTVNQAPVTTTLASSGPSAFGQPVTFTDTVCAAPPSTNPALPPGGTVTFRDGGTLLGTGTLSPGGGTNCSRTQVSASNLLPGTHTITAQYSGDTRFLAGGLESTTQTVTCTRTITGSVPDAVFAGNGSTCIVNATVGGTVHGAAGGALFISNSTIRGSILSSDGTLLGVCGSTVTGSVNVARAGGFVVIGDPGDDGCAGNGITGLVALSNNHSGAEVIANHVGGSVQVQGTTGTGPFPEDSRAEIEGNTIGGSLSCSGNVPAPTNDGNPNTVAGARLGQCSNL